MFKTKVVTPTNLDDLNSLFCTNTFAEKCWCMWHIISVKAFHAGGTVENRKKFIELIKSEDTPIGILAYKDASPIGWCAVGPRERYERALKTPTYRTKDVDSYSNVWLVPCFLVHPDAKGQGLTETLLEAAVKLAKKHKAEAIEGFPFTSEKRRSSGQIHVGFESTFEKCGFETLRTPSTSRVVMRRVL